jgi:peptidoglycan/LPS O-acetylase OafA/YrhL
MTTELDGAVASLRDPGSAVVTDPLPSNRAATDVMVQRGGRMDHVRENAAGPHRGPSVVRGGVAAAQPSGRIRQLDLMRIPAMTGVVAVHAIGMTQPASSLVASGVLVILHANRDVFFFVTAFVLQYSAATSPARRFWRKRYPSILVPYLFWTLTYVALSGGLSGALGTALSTLGSDLALGWSHLYFLVVTMQFYAVFPALAWLVRRMRARGHLVLVLGAGALQVIETAILQYHVVVPGGVLNAWYPLSQAMLPTYAFFFILGMVACVHRRALHAWLSAHQKAAVAFALFAACAAEAVYVLGLAAGRGPGSAAGPLQPVVLLTGVAAVAGFWLLGTRLLATSPLRGRLWRTVAFCADISFGVFLVHILVLRWIVVPLEARIGVDGVGPTGALVTITAVLVASALITTVGRGTPLSLALTGRGRRRSAVRGGQPVARRRDPTTGLEGVDVAWDVVGQDRAAPEGAGAGARIHTLPRGDERGNRREDRAA